MPIASDELLMVGCVSGDIERLYDTNQWCPVLALDPMVGTDQIYVFDWTKNAVTHILEIGEWTPLHGIAYQIEIIGFDQFIEPIVAAWDVESFINEAYTGHPCNISHIYGCEMRIYPEWILDGDLVDRTKFVLEYSVPGHKAYRTHPMWRESVKFLATRATYSTFYEGCEEGLVEAGLAKGYITKEDLEASRRRRQMHEDYSI